MNIKNLMIEGVKRIGSDRPHTAFCINLPEILFFSAKVKKGRHGEVRQGEPGYRPRQDASPWFGIASVF